MKYLNETLAPPPHTRWRVPPLPTSKTKTPFSILRRLLFFPLTRQRARARFLDFRHGTLPSFRQRAHSRIYRAFVERQARTQKRRAADKGVLSFFLRQRRLKAPGAVKGAGKAEKNADRGSMAQSGRAGSVMSGEGGGRERGARRRKVYGYLKAANELRQTYSAQWSNRDMDGLDNEGVPGGFPDVEIARSGSEEMVLFPSYARRHIKKDVEGDIQREREREGSAQSSDDENYWRRELETRKHDNAVVDVDVRGWIYSPHRGQMTRKHRLVVALARRLSGISAPSSSPDSDAGGSAAPGGGIRARAAKHDEDRVRREAQSIINRGEGEANAAWKGSYSQDPSSRSRSRNRTFDTTESDLDDRPAPETPTRRPTGQQTTMTREELSVANSHLMSRLRPFLADPRVSTPITVFFFNDSQSQSRTVSTNEAGHFSIRVPLDFVPTNVRVLASETLSAMEEVKIIEPRGVSMISDIDDTIKHSAIASGAKEIFRNTFVRELGDLRVLGVEEWYSKMDSMGVRVHYVSNSPWQLYPLLKSYFNLVGLPPGSFHLKQYTGMFQGIFEPAAEKKKGPLERIMRDFPERKFILVGDSGEADLEVYTEVVLENPGRVIGVFIRDVTTTEQKKFFDSSSGHLDQSLARSASPVEDSSDQVDNRPTLPPRLPPRQPEDQGEADLIDLNDEEPSREKESDTPTISTSARVPPAKPSKPSALRTNSTDNLSRKDANTEGKEGATPSADIISRKPAPPKPSKPRRLSSAKEDVPTEQPPPLPPGPRRTVPNSDTADRRPNTGRQQPPNAEHEGYTSSMRNKLTDVYNNLPSARAYWNGSSQSSPDLTGNQQQPNSTENSAGRQKQPPPPPPPRRSGTASSVASKQSSAPPQQSYTAAAASTIAQYAPNHLPWKAPTPSSSSSSLRATNPSSSAPTLSGQSTIGGTNNTNNYDHSHYSNSTSIPAPNKREEVWNRRWARAEEIFEREGVVLRSWRVGDDARDVCVWLVDQTRKEMAKDGNWDEKG
ncbi:hypothetical protein FQN54_009991 [Arachnomyces sp. PD_36]|nr:hypothetical protein FQN54_009991 [Arachnomyces sp. PD_36]